MPPPLDRRAITLSLISYICWGFFPIYWKLLSKFPSPEILAHRFIWAFVFYAGIYQFTHRRGALKALRAQDQKAWFWATASALLLGLNWGIYIYAVNSGQILQGSLAYFVNPLLSVAVGVLLFNEAFPWVLKMALLFAALGAVNQAVFAGTLPWIATVLAVSFCTYGVIKKRLTQAPELSSLMEGTVGLLPALIAAVYLRIQSQVEMTWWDALLFMGSGVVTGLPLYFFSAAAQKLPLSLMGMMQFIGPTLQFLVGIFMYGEVLHATNLITFGLIWAGVGFYFSYQLHRWQKRAAVRMAN